MLLRSLQRSAASGLRSSAAAALSSPECPTRVQGLASAPAGLPSALVRPFSACSLQNSVPRASIPRRLGAVPAVGAGFQSQFQPQRTASIFSKLRGSVGAPVKAEPAPEESDDFDLIVIGGGSGGLAVSREAARLGKRVVVLDFVDPSPHGSTWGLGGTCVNVGCIPKKLFHRAGIIHEDIEDAHSYGWRATTAEGEQGNNAEGNDQLSKLARLDWPALRLRVHEQIRSLNFGYRKRLRDDGVAYINAKGSFVDAHTVLARFGDGTERRLNAKHVALAVGNRPKPLGVPGEELAISSDDVFGLEEAPGKTLCIGGSYVSLETAGFLNALGLESQVMARSILLRGMDQEVAAKIGADLERRGVPIRYNTVPVSLRRNPESGRIVVRFRNTQSGEEAEEEFDTVLNAIGRAPYVEGLNLEAAGVKLAANGKILADLHTDRTSAENVFALGDAVVDRPELTPVAIQAGRLLARRLYMTGGEAEKAESKESEVAEKPPKADPSGYWRTHAHRANRQLQVRYDLIPSTVFTPLEYSMCGLSEEQATAQLGEQGVRVYHSYFQPLEWTLPRRGENTGFVKVVCDANRGDRVVGLHYVGPNAAEVMQGFSVAMQLGLSYPDLQDAIAIHPCTAEEVLLADIAKDSGLSPVRVGCCG